MGIANPGNHDSLEVIFIHVHTAVSAIMTFIYALPTGRDHAWFALAIEQAVD